MWRLPVKATGTQFERSKVMQCDYTTYSYIYRVFLQLGGCSEGHRSFAGADPGQAAGRAPLLNDEVPSTPMFIARKEVHPKS